MSAHSRKVGARKVTIAELRRMPEPRPLGEQHRPVAHATLLDTLEERVKAVLGANIAKMDLAVGKGGYGKKDAALFATLVLTQQGVGGTSYAIGVRQSNDRSMAVQMVAGMNVFVCDNMAFMGDTTFLHEKHLKGLELPEEIDRGLEQLKPKFKEMAEGVTRLRREKLTEDRAKAIMVDAFMGGVMPMRMLPAVMKEWAEPRHREFSPRTAWSLHNAFTEIMKGLPVTVRERRCQELGRMMGLGA